MVACKRLYNSPCQSVGPPVCQMVHSSFPSLLCITGAAKAVLVSNGSSGLLGKQFCQHCSCSIAPNWRRCVYSLVVVGVVNVVKVVGLVWVFFEVDSVF